MIAGSLFFGLCFGMAASLSTLSAIGGITVAAVVLIAASFRYSAASVCFSVAMLLPVISGISVTENSVLAPLRQLDDLVFAIGFALLPFAARLVSSRARVWFAVGGVLLAVSEAAGVLGSPASFGVTLGAAWMDIRWLGIVGWAAFILSFTPRTVAVTYATWMAVAWAAANTVVATVQIGGAGLQYARENPSLASGIFGHSTNGSVSGIVLASLIAADMMSERPHFSRRWHLSVALLVCADLLVSTRFKALLAIGCIVLIIAAVQRFNRPVVAIAIIVLIPIGSCVWLQMHAPTERSSSPSLVQDALSHGDTRAALFAGASRLAAERPPLGYGLGTFGADIDRALEDRAFERAGLATTWGFTANFNAFRADTMLARVLGERGWGGLVLWILGLAAFAVAALAATPRDGRLIAVIGGMLALVPVSGAFMQGTVVLLFFPLVIVGLAQAKAPADRARPHVDGRSASSPLAEPAAV